METKAKEEKNFTFSYDLVRPLFRHKKKEDIHWYVLEKGSEKAITQGRGYKISYDIIKSALSVIKEHIRITPCDQSLLFNNKGFEILLKRELYQITNGIEAHGAVYSLLQLSEKQKRNGVITISTDSFAPSLCYFGKKFKIPVTVVMLKSTAIKIINMCQGLGATVIVQGIKDIIQAHEEALRITKERGLVYIDRNDHPNMIIGQATLGLEIMEKMTDIDTVILPTLIIDCGLTAGLAMAIKGCNPDIKVIEVESAEYSDCSEVSYLIRRRTAYNKELDTKMIEYAWHSNAKGIVKNLFDKTVIVKKTFIEDMKNFLLQKGDVVELNPTIGLAAILSGKLDELKGKRVVIPVFDGIDWSVEFPTDDPSLEPGAGPSNA